MIKAQSQKHKAQKRRLKPANPGVADFSLRDNVADFSLRGNKDTIKAQSPKELPGWRDVEVGAIVTEPGSASEYRTGDWRSQRPVWDREKCIRCGICYIYCPEGSVLLTTDGYFENDLYYCKGCGICATECWCDAIIMEEEGED